ncbi:class I SAM-dependent methyltransferase [Paenibacillus sp. 481]|uniref:class I SAM-dependent methyltransferase n=1 Tax=Paenibacillus sp. 481 TaxID=2835869 RepID=UPI001E3C77F5|nr:class I SAM-dependent methyltransferase [Paenibacillus sp. 481]UHA72746.1 class I SAM-dependent methyltransferase [Paenibacillus sp. 481]
METLTHNKEAWNTGAYEAWVKRFGTPEEAATKLQQNPVKRLGPIYKHIEHGLNQKRVINLLGSNGNKAVALALLGADATVVDFSEDNEKYAQQLASAANVNIRYILSDVLHLPAEELTGDYDVVMMENGILHYFADLKPLFQVVAKLLRSGGELVLHDFHPVTTKLITSKGTTANIRKHKVTGNYFNTDLVEKEISFSKFLHQDEHGAITTEQMVQKVYLRHWTLGEVVTAVASEGLYVKILEELPNLSSEVFDMGIPKTFTLVAQKV